MIDYARIGRALSYYESMGYTRVEVPWFTSKPIVELTKPPEAPHCLVYREGEARPHKSFVASAEQGFLYLIRKGYMPSRGKFVACSPCVRPETVDIDHLQRFVKVELICYDDCETMDAEGEFYRMATAAERFFKTELSPECDSLFRKRTSDESLDLVLAYPGERELELGSYGIRECEFCRWVYGTGLAEPRFSQAFELSNRKKKR